MLKTMNSKNNLNHPVLFNSQTYNGYQENWDDKSLADSTSPRQFSHLSPWLLAFGIIDLLLSGILLAWCTLIGFTQTKTFTIYLGLSCAFFQIILGSLSAFGGYNDVRFRSCIIASLIFGVFYMCVFILITTWLDLIRWFNPAAKCKFCSDNCFFPCYFSSAAMIYIPIVLPVALQTIVVIIMSIICCVKLRVCSNRCFFR